MALALTSRGDLVLLGLLLAAVAAQPLAVPAVVIATAAALVRFGSSSLGALAGAQAVLGPAGLVAPAAGAAASWVAAAALVLCTPAVPAVEGRGARRLRGRADGRGRGPSGPAAKPPRADKDANSERLSALALRRVAGAAPFGLVAALVVAGPGPGGELEWRVAASVAGTVLAVGVGRVRRGARVNRALGVGAVLAATAALILALVAR